MFFLSTFFLLCPPTKGLKLSMATRDASNKMAPSNLVAFPSLSSSLHSLPHATSMQNVALHPNMYAQRAAESEAKVSTNSQSLRLSSSYRPPQLQKALSKTASSYSQHPPPTPSYMMQVSLFSLGSLARLAEPPECYSHLPSHKALLS